MAGEAGCRRRTAAEAAGAGSRRRERRESEETGKKRWLAEEAEVHKSGRRLAWRDEFFCAMRTRKRRVLLSEKEEELDY